MCLYCYVSLVAAMELTVAAAGKCHSMCHIQFHFRHCTCARHVVPYLTPRQSDTFETHLNEYKVNLKTSTLHHSITHNQSIVTYHSSTV